MKIDRATTPTTKGALTLIIISALLGPVAVVVGADRFQPDVVVLSQQWFLSPVDSGSAIPCFQAANDSVVELQRRRAVRCSNYQGPESSAAVEAPHENAEENRRESVVKAPEYVYQIRLRNKGTKTIKGVLWDYVFSEPQTGDELARHTFFSEIQLLPGKIKSVTATSIKPPTRVISVGMLFNNYSGHYTEQIQVKRILYADGSVWQRD